MRDGRTRLTDDDVARLRAMRAEGFKYVEIAEVFSISLSGAHAIVSGKTRTKPIGYRVLLAPVGKRFYSQVRRDPDGCWRWTSRLSPAGYGQFKISSRTAQSG